MVNLCLNIPADQVAIFFPILQDGLKIQADLGCSIKQFLHTTFHISSEYIESRIPTIMLNGKAVDDLDTAILEENATLALSSAMPGLAGATLRRGGALAPMRSGITYREQKKSKGPQRGIIRVKFFNVLTRELGLKLLYQGISMSGMDLMALLRVLLNPLKNSCANMMIDDKDVTMDELQEKKIFADDGEDEIFVQIKLKA